MRRRSPLILVALVLAALAALPAAASANGVEYVIADGAIGAQGATGAAAECARGSEAVGGAVGPRLLAEGGISARISEGAGSAWSGYMEARNSAFGSSNYQVAAACIPTATLLGSATHPSQTVELGSVLIHARGKPPLNSWAVYCGGGEQVISGGFSVQHRQNPVRGYEPVLALVSVSRLTPGATGWETTAQNYNSVEETVTSSAYCLPRQIARGLLEMHYYEESAKLEAGAVEAFCGPGEQSLGGGFESPRPRSEWEATHFLPGGEGFEAYYHSPNVFDHDLVTVDTTCTSPPPAYLGPLNKAAFQGFCEESVSPGSIAVEGADADEWTCVEPGGKVVPIGGEVALVCYDHYYPNGASALPKAVYLDLEDPQSWNCWSGERGTIEAQAESGSIAPAGGGATASSVDGRRGSPGKVLTLSGRVRLPKGLSFARTSVRVKDLALERSAQGELITGKDPLAALPALRRVAGHGATVSFRGGRSPRIALILTRLHGRTFDFRMTSRGGRFHRPELCGAGRTSLLTRFQILRAGRRLADIEAAGPWSCGRGSYTTP